MISLKVSGNLEKSLHVRVKAKNQHWMRPALNVKCDPQLFKQHCIRNQYGYNGLRALRKTIVGKHSEFLYLQMHVKTPCNAKYINNIQKLWDEHWSPQQRVSCKVYSTYKRNVRKVNVRKALMRVTVSKAVEPNNNPGLQTMMEIYISKNWTILQGGAQRGTILFAQW